MPRVHRAAFGALLLAAVACAAPAPPPPSPVDSAESAESTAPLDGAETTTAADPLLGPALDRVVANVTGRFSFEVVIDLGDDAASDALGPVVTTVEGAFDRAAGRSAVGPVGTPPVVHDGAFEADPTAFAEVLRGADELDPDGEEAVRGVPARRYRAVVHLDRVLERVSDDRRMLVGGELDALADLLDEVGAPAESDAVDARVWLAADGALVRVELAPAVAAGTFGPGATARLTLDLYDDGKAIIFEAPGGTVTP